MRVPFCMWLLIVDKLSCGKNLNPSGHNSVTAGILVDRS